MTVSDFQRGFITSMMFGVVVSDGCDLLNPGKIRSELDGLLNKFGLASLKDTEVVDIYEITQAINLAEPRQDNLKA